MKKLNAYFSTKSHFRPKKIKGLFALLARKSGGSVGRCFFFQSGFGSNAEMQKCNTIHMCALLGMQNLRIKVNPGVERGLYSIISG